MKRNTRFLRFKVMGEDCAVQFFERLSTADISKPDVFHCGNKYIRLDGHLPRDMAKVMPHTRCTDGNLWKPFLQYWMSKWTLADFNPTK